MSLSLHLSPSLQLSLSQTPSLSLCLSRSLSPFLLRCAFMPCSLCNRCVCVCVCVCVCGELWQGWVECRDAFVWRSDAGGGWATCVCVCECACVCVCV